MNISFLWKNGLEGAFTTSWDDGTTHDRRLVEIHNKNDIKGTWNLNSSKLGLNKETSGWKDFIQAEEVSSLYSGHEVASHTLTHPRLESLPYSRVLSEIIMDRMALEELCGYVVEGFAFPFGSGGNCSHVLKALEVSGVVYSRETEGVDDFSLPTTFMNWKPTCHLTADLPSVWESFLNCQKPDKLLYLWGHSYEFEDRGMWSNIESFYSLVSKESENIWLATNIEVYRYVMAYRGLKFGVNGSCVYNPSGETVFIKVDNKTISIPPGCSVALND